MNILIITATKLEINIFLSKINCNKFNNISFHGHKIDILISGIGLVFTAYNITKTLLIKHYDLYINVGIAGSFNKNLRIGEVVNVKSEEFADLGAERPEGFKTAFELGFVNNNEFPFTNGKLINNSNKFEVLHNLVSVSAISTNTAHANADTIKYIENKFKADIETMEGAAFFYVCLQEKLQFVQIRSISNYVEPDNRDQWNIPLSVNNLSDFLIDFLISLRSS